MRVPRPFRGCARPQVFACTVGQKPSKAPFYVNDPAEVLSVLSKLAESGRPKQQPAAHHNVTFAE